MLTYAPAQAPLLSLVPPPSLRPPEVRLAPVPLQGGARPRGSREAIPQRQVLDASVDVGVQALHRARHLERLQAREQVVEDHLELDAREVCAEAEVLVGAECEVGVRAAIDAE